MTLDQLTPWIPVALIVAFFVFRRLGQISPEQARTLVASGAKLVDVRSTGEFASGHLPNAINVPVQSLGAGVSKLGQKDAPLILYCASGARSAMARSTLKRMGFTQVYNLGPMSRW